MTLEINDPKLFNAIEDVLNHLRNKFGEKNFALFGQIDVQVVKNKDDEVRSLILMAGVFSRGSSASPDGAKIALSEIDVINSLVVNRKSARYEKEALQPILDKHGYKDETIL